MALPSSGILGLNTIADGSTSAVGVVTPYSLNQLCILTGVNGYTDGGWFWNNKAISGFYNYPGYGYKYGSPAMLHDFGLSSRFSTSSNSILDTSGNSRDALFVTGTGNGTANNISVYNTAFPGNIQTSTSGQYSMRLNDVAKFSGTQSYTVLSWVKVSSFGSNYPGIVAAEGRSSGGQPIGWSLYFDNVSGYHITHARWNGTTGSSANTVITFASGSVPSFSLNKWYMVVAKYDGAAMSLSLYADGTRYDAFGTNSFSLATSTSWSAFIGLRYNNWLDGAFGYTALYTTALTTSDYDIIYSITRQRYGV